MRTQVLLVDDHPIVRRGYRALLEAHEGIAVCAEADSPLAAMKAVRSANIDVAVVDIRLPGAGGLRLCQRLHRYFPAMRILLFSAQSDGVTRHAAREAGAAGFLDKRAPGEALAEAVQSVARGHTGFMHNRMNAAYSEAIRLSAREEAIVGRLAAGEDVQQIATRFAISPKTVANHLYAARDKLRVDSLADVVRYGVERAAPSVGLPS